LPANVPRVERILPCALDQRIYKRCEKETVVIGNEESSQLAVPKVEAILSVVESCRRLQVWVRNLLSRDSPRACRSSDQSAFQTLLPRRLDPSYRSEEDYVWPTPGGIISNYARLEVIYQEQRGAHCAIASRAC